ncbi:Hep/Hag repeat protein [Veillonella dispar ATCC 17748]|uniref:Hep/Hag repeat protein n=1 Tax=Veillonella dispar ATCC 17748 TaxID=546273 RepID=C4FMC5_9FIRM|nr:ESPR-type extended signal peptide-containing protein [Veillonella dispar]EEP65939.1 Hep/Hag repeat protein [Veillonella dispar ATCC 17748]VEG92651.1 Adhesin yadA precursor [Veillonella dispar]
MNKVFKVVYSKSKGCYVVVPETAKNNNGKKKVLASVLAGLAVAGAMGGVAPLEAQAGYDTSGSHVNIWADTYPKSNGQNYNVGQNSIVVGYQNTTDDVAGHDGKVAIGAKNTSTNNATTAVGNRNTATGGAATAVGAGNTASGNGSVAVGNVNNADAKAAVAIGTYNNVNYTKGSWETTPKNAGEYSTVVGNYSSATGTSASAMGVYTNATGAGSFAAGYNNNAKGQNSVAIGSENTSHVADTVTLGQFNNAKTMGGISIGKNNLTDSTNGGRNFAATADENSQIAIGRDNEATHLDTIAIGRETKASGSGATVIGARAEASGNNAIAIGQSGKDSPKVIAKGVNSIAIGMQSQTEGESGVAVGAGTRANGQYGVAVGHVAKANVTRGTALGDVAEANIAEGVALGASSVTTTDKGVVGYNPSDPHERKYSPLTGNVKTATTAAVSIGNGQQMTRQLTGLAAGTADTDAVNVAQLKNVGVAVTGNTGKSDFLTDGGKLNVIGTGRVSTVAAHDGAKDSKITVGFDDKGMVKAGKNVTVNEVTVDGRTTYTINAADTAAKYDFLTNATANGGKLDGEATPTKVQSGTTVNYAAGKNLTVKQDIETSLGQQTYTYSLNKDLKEITSITNNGGPTMNFGSNNISITGGNLDLGNNNITNLKSGGDVINNAANIGDVTRISKANDLHIAPTAGTNNNVAEYTVDANKKVTLTYQDGNGKTVNGPKAVIDLSGLKTGDMSSFNVKSTATEGKVAQGSAGVQEIRDGKTVEMQAGKNMTIKQTNNNGNAAVEFALNKDIDLTPDGSIKIGDTNITDNGLTINGGPSITKTGINAGGLNITNVKAGVNDNDAVNVSQLKQVRADERHIKPGEYAVDNNGKVTMTYVDGNNKDVPNETAVITGIAKQDLSNINNGGKTVIKNLAKEAIDMENGKNTTASHRDVNGVKTFKVDVEGDLTDITSITNKAGDGKIAFGGNQTVNVAGDHNIAINAKAGDITGLTNVTLDAPDFAKKGRAATEEQLNIVNNKFNNTVGLTGNTGATELQKLNKQGGLSFGVVGANNGEYIKTTASGSNVVADLSDSAKNKLNSTVEVQGKNAAKVTSTVVNNADGSTKTIYTVDVNNVKPTAASTEKVQAKADVAGSSDKNIAKVSPKAGENFGDAGATYEVNVSRNDVKDAAREAVTVNTTNTTNNPITVTPVQDEANHNTTYQVTFDGNKAAKQIPLTYKANGQNAQTVTLDKGLNFTNGKNTTASVDAEGVVKYDVNKDLVNINSISNTTNGPKMEFGPNSINITNGPINMGDQNITNLKSGGDVVNNAANIGDVTRISKANDLHIAPTSSNRQGETTTSYAYDAASKSVTLKYNDGNGANQSGTVAKIDLSGLADQIKDGYSFSTDAKGNVVGNHAVTPVANGKTVSYAAGKNLTVAQNIDNATGEHTYTYALSNDVDLTPNGSLKIGDTILNNGGLTITGGPSVTKTGINAGNLNITNVKAGVNDTDAVNVKQLKDSRTVVTSNDKSVTVNKTENGNQVTYDLHVAPGAAQSVWNVKSTGNTTADSEAAAKTITDGKTVEMAAGKNLTVKQTSNEDGAKVEFGLAGDLTNIKTIKNEGPATFTIGGNEFKFDGGNVNMGDNNITNLKSGGDVINNAANIGDVKRISKANDIHIKDKTYTVNADKTVTLEYVDGNDNAVNKTAKIDLSNLPTGDKAAVESVVKKSAAAGDTNIADITVADGKQTGDANAKYEVNVSRNAVKDAAREAVTVNTTNTTNNPITVTPVQDETNHNTTYTVTFDGDKAAKQIPLTYKANGSNDQKVTLDKGLNFTNGSNTTASVAADGVVKYDLNNNVNLTPSGSLTIGDTVVNNGGLTISGGPSVLKTGINAGNLNITNVKAGVNDTDAVNVKQLKDSRTVVTSNDKSVTVNKTENGNQVTYDLHVAPGAAQSTWNVKSSGNTTADSETTAKTISDGKTVEMAAGKNLTVKQTSNNDGAKVEYALSDDIKVGNDGKDGKDGVDGKIGVNGKDGSAVVINGKDGSIGLNGKDGKDGLTIRGANGQDGVNGTNGTNGITRIVYEDKNNNKHEVATTDDGLKFTGNNTDVVNKNKLNSLVKVQGEGVDKTTSASFKSASGNINVKADGTDTLEVQLNKDLKNITSIKNDGPATMTIGGNEFKFNGGNVNMGGNNITNLKSGGDVIDNAANIGDVTRISKANDLHIAPTKSDRAGEATTSYSYNVADKSVTLKYNDGNGANQANTIAKIDLSGLADQIKDGYSFSTDAKGNVVGNHAVTAVGNGKTVSYAAGDNLTITQKIDNTTGEQTYTYALSNDIKVGNDGKDGKDGVDGKIGVNGKDGSAVVINGKDGSIGLNGKDGKDGLTMKAKDGQPGVNGKDGITRIVYEDNSKNTHEVATLDDGMKYAGDDAQGADKSKVIAKKLNETMDVVGGADKSKLTDNNIGVNNVDGKLKVQLSKEVNLTPSGSLTIGDTVVNNGGLTISGGPSVLKTGINAGNLNITNVKAGVNDTDAVNVKQLKSAKTEVKAGDNVTVDKTIGADGQNIYTVNAKATNLGDAELNYTANGGAKQKVKLSEGLNFVDGNYTKASVDANGVVKYDVTLGKVRDGVDGKPGVDGENGIATVKTLVDTINNSGWKGDVTGNTVGDHSATIVKPGTTVNFGAGKNLTVEQIVDKVTGNHTYNYALSDDIKVGNDGKDGKPGVDGKIGVNGKDGSAVVINGKDGSIGLNGKDGKDGLTFKGANGQDGVDGKNGTNGMTRIVYEDSNKNKHEVATTDDGLKFTGNNESVVNKNKLNSTVKVKGEGVTEEQEKTFESAAGNIAVTADGNDTLNIRLNKNIKGIDSIQTKEIHLGTPDNYTTIKKDGDRIKYGDKTFANTDDIWTIQANGTDVPANGGKVNVKGADGITVSKSANGEMTISGAGLGTMNSFNVKSSGNTTADSETTAKRITDGKTVEFSGGKNLTVKQTSDENGAKVEYALSNNVDLTNKGSVTIGDTKITDGGLVINNGPSVTKDGINAGNKQITNVDDGVNDTDAVNVRQLKAAKTNLVDGQNTKVTGDGSKANPYKVNVEGDLNKITSITNNEGDGKLEFKGDQVVNVAGDNTIKLDGKTGDITGLTNKTLDSADFATKGRAATEEQLKLVQQEAAKKSTEKVQAKADANNIAKVAPKAGDTFGAAGATYEVSVDKNDVKDAAREAVTVTGDNKAITVDVQPNATNHTTNYQVNFNGNEAAKQIPLTYKENGGNARTVMLSEGLDFSNGVNTTAHTDANGKVSFDVKGDLTNITSISNNSNGPKVSFGGDTVNITGGNLNMGGNKITNVQKGTNDTDAVNVKQLKDSRTTLTSDDQSVVLKKTESADGGLNYDLSVKGAVDPRVDQLNEEIGRVGAQGAALSALKPMQYDPLEPTQIMAGYGNYRGNSAIAVGVAHYKNESTMFHGGLSWAGGSSHMMANAGVTWKVGNRDAEAAVADRYRKGPISSAYAVQTEMAAMKAQNAGLKGEVSDLKYENEQIKAQNAGLQSEVEVLKAQMAAMMAKMGM